MNVEKKILKKARLHYLNINKKWEINNVETKHINHDSFFDSRKE